MHITRKIILAAGILAAVMLAGCSSVSFTPREGEEELPSKPRGFEVPVLDPGASGYRIIGVVSCSGSASSSIWNWWTDEYVLINELKAENRERLIKKVRAVGGDAILGLNHEVMIGGRSGGVGVGVGTSSGNVGFGVGTSLFSGSPKIYVISNGDVGVTAGGSGDD
jgi:hypothetical protein